MLDLHSVRDLIWYLTEDSKQVPSKLLLEDADRLGLFEAVHESFKLAATKAGSQEKFYKIGEDTICLRFAGDGLPTYIIPAIAHLATEPILDPSLTVCLWDSVSTQTNMAALVNLLLHLIEARWEDFLEPRKEIKGWHSDRLNAQFHIGPNILSLLDHQRSLGIYWIDDAVNIPYFEKGSPLQTILNWWTSKHNYQYIHGGAVGIATGGVLIVGKGGSGKSTSTLACLKSDLTYASDDYCLVNVDTEAQLSIYSLYNTAKLRGRADIARFPHLADKMTNLEHLETEKALVFLQQHYPQKVVSRFPLRAILVPEITGKSTTEIEPTSKAIALKALAPSTLFQLSGIGKNSLQNMAQLTQKVPCYKLKLGTNITEIPKVILNLISDS